MTLPQIEILALLVIMLAGFAAGRFRFELVALCALAAGVVLGLVPAESAFAGFANPAVITVLEILLIVQVLRRSQLIEAAGSFIDAQLGSDSAIVIAIAVLGAVLSVFMNNIGALALLLPLAVSASDRRGLPLKAMLMPLSFATLLGGMCSVIGTPANLVANAMMLDTAGHRLGFFDLALVGAPVALVGLAYLVVMAFRTHREAQSSQPPVRHERRYATELVVGATSPLCALTLREAERAHAITIHNIVRDGRYVFGGGDRLIKEGDLLVLEAREDALDRLVAEGGLVPLEPESWGSAVFETVLLPESVFIGSCVDDLVVLSDLGITIVRVGISARRIEGRLGDIRLAVGDILQLRGERDAVAAECAEVGLLMLGDRPETAAPRPAYFPAALFAAGIIASAFFGIDPAIAFGGVVLVFALTGQLSLRRGLETMNWPILVMLGAIIPLGVAVADTGAGAALAQAMADLAPETSPQALIVVMLVLAVLLTPFINNPSTVLVLAPVGSELARQFGLPPEPIIVAVTIGASLDFMTPFGHHNNTLVMGIAGYSVGDFFRFGFPLVLLTTAAAAVTAIVVFIG